MRVAPADVFLVIAELKLMMDNLSGPGQESGMGCLTVGRCYRIPAGNWIGEA